MLTDHDKDMEMSKTTDSLQKKGVLDSVIEGVPCHVFLKGNWRYLFSTSTTICEYILKSPFRAEKLNRHFSRKERDCQEAYEEMLNITHH